MYKDKLIVAIKHNGKVLRENKDLILLPFGSEFSVLVKNLNNRRVKFTLSIDGANALDDTEIIVNANSEIEIKRFIRNGNMEEGNAFRFVERTKSIEDGPRGVKIDDGIIRLEFWFEKEKPEIDMDKIYWDNYKYRDYYQQGPFYRQPLIYGPFYRNTTSGIIGGGPASGQIIRGNEIFCSTQASTAQLSSATLNSGNVKAQSLNSIISDTMQEVCKTATSVLSDNDQEITKKDISVPINDVGITVPGSKVEQKFATVYGFVPETTSHVIILRLAGMSGETVIEKPITVATKPKCVTCGKLNKAVSKFCTECGTSLQLF